MNDNNCLQQILGTDKKNPIFNIYRDPTTPVLHVYYGGEIFEKIVEDFNNPEFKIMIGRLYNARINQTSIKKAFNIDVRTMKRWGYAIKCGNPEEMIKILAGRFANQKLTAEIIGYINFRFPKIYEKNSKSYNQQLRKEIEEIFKVKLCSETIRPFLKKLKIQIVKTDEKIDLENINNIQTSGEITKNINEDKCVSPLELRDDTDIEPSIPRQRSANFSDFLKVGIQFRHHLGILIFSVFLLKVESVVGDKGWIIKQWLACLLLGAVNIEQTKLLDFDDLTWMFEKTLRCLHPQRTELELLTSTDTADKLLKLNAEFVSCKEYDDFYYDPHTKHYTGQLKILKGWCGSKHYTDKVHHMDFIHTTDGHPVFISYSDNYLDLRERFFENIKMFKEKIYISEKTITVVVDRGIYGLNTFDHIIIDPKLHLITWAKDYHAIAWNSKDVQGAFILERCRNGKDDIKKFHFEYMEELWQKDSRMRLIRVKATNPKNKTIQLGILADDKNRPASEIIRLMFKRWIQENDFKYLEKHFGINQITSYKFISYKKLQDQVEDKQIKSGEYLAIQKERKDLRLELKNLLFQENQHPNKNPIRSKKIKNMTEQDQALGIKLNETKKEISKLDHLIKQNYCRLDISCKKIMDLNKIIARNIFYQMLQPFKKLYNNFRDDHVMFRNLIRSHGYVIETQNKIIIHLIPTAHYSPSFKKIIEEFLETLNQSNVVMPDNSNRIIVFKIGEKMGFKLASN